MGSGGSSQQPPKETQSAPATARSTPKPRRNQQFQEVQLNPAGGNPKSRTTPRAQGASPKPNHSTTQPQQSTSGQRGQDPGASGSSTDRSTRGQQPPQRGAAANGKPTRKTEMASTQKTNVANDTKKEEKPERTKETQAANGSPGANNSSSTGVQMVNGKPQKGTPVKGHVTGIFESKAGKKKNTVILVKPGKPIAGNTDNQKQTEKDDKGSEVDKKGGKSASVVAKNVDNKTADKPGSKTGILQRSKIFRTGLGGITEENEEDSSDQTEKAKKENVITKRKQTDQRKGITSKPGQPGTPRKAEGNKHEQPGKEVETGKNIGAQNTVKRSESKGKETEDHKQTANQQTKKAGEESKKEDVQSKSPRKPGEKGIGLNKKQEKAIIDEQTSSNDKSKGNRDKKAIGLNEKHKKETIDEQTSSNDKSKGNREKKVIGLNEKQEKPSIDEQISSNDKNKGIVDKKAKRLNEKKEKIIIDEQTSSNDKNNGSRDKKAIDLNEKQEKAIIDEQTSINDKNKGNLGKKDPQGLKVEEGIQPKKQEQKKHEAKKSGKVENKDNKDDVHEVSSNKLGHVANSTPDANKSRLEDKAEVIINAKLGEKDIQDTSNEDDKHKTKTPKEKDQKESQIKEKNETEKLDKTKVLDKTDKSKTHKNNHVEEAGSSRVTDTHLDTKTAQEDVHKNTSKGKKSKMILDEEGNINFEVLDKVTDQIQRLQEEAENADNLSQPSYDNFYEDDNEIRGNETDQSHDLDAGGQASGASQADEQDPEVLSTKEEDIVFETFYHRSGKEFQCIYQNGMRFYLDSWGSKEWQPFPKRWYNEGLLVTNTIVRDDGTGNGGNDQAGASGQGTSRSQGRGQGQGGSGGGGGSSDDREGFIMHPKRGRVPTYIFYKKHNVHMYFDKDTGSWVRLPIGWELHHDMVKSLVDQVEEAIPTWGDRHDILALLRACNYDPDECISIYLHLEKDEWMKAPRTSKEAKGMDDKDNRIAELEKKNRDLELELEKERQRREELERNVDEQNNKMSELEAESKQTEAQMSAMTGGRPKSARPISVMMMAGKGKGGKGGKQQQKAGEIVNPDDVLDLNANAKELRKAHSKLRNEVERYFGDFKHIVLQVGPAIKKLKASEKGTQVEIEEVRALYRKEALQRKLLYNQLQELRGNIRVFCRVRKDDRSECCLKFPSDQDILCVNPQQGKKSFNFDKVFDPSSTQEQVFEDTKPIISSCADGYNVCLLAYGQTGSGKTFTMMGPENNPGINIRAMKELFKVCKERSETMSYTLTVSLVEIYNETIQDLLTSDAKTLELRTAGNKVVIPGLIEYPIKNVDDVKTVMALGDSNRSVASTKMNSTSSRSHLVLMLAVEGKDKVTNAITRGTLVLCDLAGSERISKTEAEGQRLVEAAAINKSLSALGQVFTALRTSQLHVPYRNSKLTQILQPSLGGDAKACVFVNVSPDTYNYLETVSTLTFGSNARQVALGQAKQNVSKGK